MIFKHELKSNGKALIIWIISIVSFDFCFMLMYPSLQKSMNEMLDAYSSMGGFTAAFGMDRLSMAEPIGFYGVYVGAILSLAGTLFAAILGSGILSKEEGGHTSEFLYTLPYNRTNVVLQKAAAVFVILLMFDVANLAFGLISFPLIHADIAWKEILLYHCSQFFLHFEIAAMSILISAFMKKVNLGAGLGITMLLYFVDMMSRVLKQLEFAKYITPYYYANAADVMNSGRIDMLLFAIGMGVTAICIGFGTWYYDKRDLAA